MTDHAQTEATTGTLYHVQQAVEDRYYLYFVAAFTTLLVLTNIIGTKLFVEPFFDTTLTAGIITYPLTFLITDVVSEVYGKRRADRMVITGFGMSLLMLIIVQMSIHLPAAEGWKSEIVPTIDNADRMQEAWHASFGVGAWLVWGSMCAYLVAQLCDNFFFHFWRRLTKGKHLWLRNNLSTPISQLLDTFIVNSFLFYGAFKWDFVDGLEVMAVIYLFKISIAFFDTPLCYLGVWGLKRQLARKGVYRRLQT